LHADILSVKALDGAGVIFGDDDDNEFVETGS
jgi:hypothetical protein